MNKHKIGFILLSNSQNPIPSTRISVLNIIPFLQSENFDVKIIYDPWLADETPKLDDGLFSKILKEQFDIIYFQKVHGPSVEKLAKKLKTTKIKTIYGVCDLINCTMTEITDATITVTDYLKSLYPISLHYKVHVIHDGIEHPEIYKTTYSDHYGSRTQPLNAILVSSANLDHLPVLKSLPSWLKVTIVGHYPQTHQYFKRLQAIYWKFTEKKKPLEYLNYLQFLTTSSISCVAWDQKEVYEFMCNADIGIIPISTIPNHIPGKTPPSWKIKSENRLTLKMAAGLPVIATPIPAYEPIIFQGVNGFLANSQNEWLNCLEQLRNPQTRETIGKKARQSVIDRFSTKRQAETLISLLKELIIAKNH